MAPRQEALAATEKVALAFKAINARGARHCQVGAEPEPQRAMERYAEQAEGYQQTAELCRSQGLRYAPLLFTGQGAMSKNTEMTIERLAQLIETQEGTPAADVKEQLCRQQA